MAEETVTPYSRSDQGKKEQVEQMFDKIAPRYDFLNHFLSMGIDVLWRRKAIRLLKGKQVSKVLDVATGTGDFALETLKLNPVEVIGVDISSGMIAKGNEKIEARGLSDKVKLIQGDSEDLKFPDNTFDIITVGFGVRNFENLLKGLKEMNRVLVPGGKCAVLEFSQPTKFPIKQLYGFYFRNILPLLGKMISADSAAYTYLPASVDAFPYGEDFLKIYSEAGFKEVIEYRVSFGIATIYIGSK